MIGLDSNILVRFLTHDDLIQTPAAIKLMGSLSPEAPGFLSMVSLAELSWVLRKIYSFDKIEIEEVIETLLLTDSVVVEQSDIVWEALKRFRSSSAGFSDCLIARSSEVAGCLYTLTFDRRAAGAGMRLLETA